MKRRGTYCSVLSVVLLAAACGMLLVTSGSAHDTKGSRSAALDPTDNCPGALMPPGRPRIEVLGRVAFPRYADPGDRIPDRFIDRQPRQMLFSKMGLSVRGAQPITLKVDDPALMAWPRQGDSAQLTLSQGTRCAGAGWHGYPGGLLVPAPGSCVKLTVVVGTRSRTLPFGVGVRCK